MNHKISELHDLWQETTRKLESTITGSMQPTANVCQPPVCVHMSASISQASFNLYRRKGKKQQKPYTLWLTCLAN